MKFTLTTHSYGFYFGIFTLLALPCLSGAPVLAAQADDFVDSMGINIKLDRSEYEKNWDAIKPRLEELGIWHYRDGLANVDKSEVFRSRYQGLFDEIGMKGLFVLGALGKPRSRRIGGSGCSEEGAGLHRVHIRTERTRSVLASEL